MKRPFKYEASQFIDEALVYHATDIDPLLDRLDELESTKPNFPTREEYRKRCVDKQFYFSPQTYAYFSQFQYETKVFPKKGDIVEGETTTVTIRGKILDIRVSDENKIHYCKSIRPVTTPTREELIKSISNKLENGTDKIIFDRELVEQFLKILKR